MLPKKVKILNVDPYNYSRNAAKTLSQIGNYEEHFCLTREEFLEKVSNVDVLVLRFSFELDCEFFEAAKTLKAIICNVTSPNHIDEDEMVVRGVSLFCLRGHYGFLKNIHATAELTWQLIMASQRPILDAVHSVRQLEWNRDLFVGNEVFGKSIGIIGVGRIGKKILKYANCFGLNVHVFDLNEVDGKDITIHKNLESIFNEKLDIYTINLSLNKDTYNIINSELLSKIKKGGALINTARGEIVDEDYIIKHSEKNGFKYFSDVISNEINYLESNLFKASSSNKNIVLTPHIGGAAYEAWWKTEEFCVENFLKSEELYEH